MPAGYPDVSSYTSRRLFPRLRPGRTGLALIAAVVAAAACLGAGSARAANSGDGLQVSSSPPLIPAFDPGISDYVVQAAPDTPVQLTVTTAPGTAVALEGQPFKEGSATSSLLLDAGQSFAFRASTAALGPVTYHVRALPPDFPAWTAERPGTPQAEWFIVTPTLNLNGATGPYVVVFDGWGAPVWWYRAAGVPLDAKLFPNGDFAWLNFDLSGAEEHRLDGSLVGQYSAVGSWTDQHEVLRLPNGNLALAGGTVRGPVDLTAYGGAPNAMVSDPVIEELSPDGSLVWYWDAMDHIPLSESEPEWWPLFITNHDPADPYHFNSIEPDGDGYVLSFRHLDAVFKVDKASGSIVWKLGGIQRPESLTVLGDPVFDEGGGFGGQHDARVLSDGTVTVHDNATLRGAPRAVRYQIDEAARTATLIEQVTDPDVPASACCGDARKLPGGDWVIAWGGDPSVTELSPSGDRAYRLTFANAFFSYRVDPVSFGVLSADALRAGMDAQFPRPVAPPMLGDLDGDGKVTLSDFRRMVLIFVGLETPTDADLLAGDVSPVPGVDGTPYGNGRIDAGDINWELLRLVGLSAAP